MQLKIGVTRKIHHALARAALLSATAALAATVPAPANAQAGSSARSFDIPAQALPDALILFGRQARIEVTAESGNTRGRKTQGVSGDMAPAEALSRLLSGTGLTFRWTSERSVMIEPAPQLSDGAIVLGPVTVEGQGEGATTELSGSYTSSTVSIGRGQQSLREIPRTVNVITRQQLDDQSALSIDEALALTSGVTVTRYNNDAFIYSMRGFPVSSILLDGKPINADVGYTDTGAFDTALFDRIEVMRGPTGLLQGAGEPSGSINLVRKRAEAELGLNVALSAGSWEMMRAEADVTGAIDKEGQLRGRVIGVYDDRDSYIDYVYSRKLIGYATLEFDATPDTTISIGTMQQDGDSRPSLGLPNSADGQLLDLDRSTYLGSLWDKQDERLERYFLDVDHTFANGGSLHVGANSLRRKTDIRQSSAGNSFPDADGTIEMYPWRSIHRMHDRSIDAYMLQPFELGGREHEIQIGVSHQVHDTQLTWGPSDGGLVRQNIYNPDPGLPEPTFNTNTNPEITSTQTGVYAQGRFRVLENTTLILGGRINWWKTRTDGDPAASRNVDGKATPYIGVIQDLSEEVSAYASYATIFEPQTDQDIDFNPLAPRTGEQFEVGVKGEHLAGRLNWQAALFQINDRNRAIDLTGVVPGPDQNPWPMVNGGKARSRGFETSVAGALAPRWDVTAGYTYTDTEQDGVRFAPATPKHDVNLWTRYRFSDGENGLRIAGGINYRSGVFAEDGGTRWQQDGYALLSAQIAYRFNPKLELAVKLNNLLDETYYSNVSGWTRQNYYGEPRSALRTLRYTH